MKKKIAQKRPAVASAAEQAEANGNMATRFADEWDQAQGAILVFLSKASTAAERRQCGKLLRARMNELTKRERSMHKQERLAARRQTYLDRLKAIDEELQAPG